MKRIDTTTKAIDLFGTGKHGFKDGNKALAIAATVIDASILNNIQEEITRVIEAAGITLNGAVYTQLLAALTAGWNLPKSTSSVSGYMVLPGGFIIQMGTSAGVGSDNQVAVTFPLAFVVNNPTVLATPVATASTIDNWSLVISASKTGCVLGRGWFTGLSGETNTMTWIAAGF